MESTSDQEETESLSRKLKNRFCEKYPDGQKDLNDAKHELLDEVIVEKAIDYVRKYDALKRSKNLDSLPAVNALSALRQAVERKEKA